MKLKVVVVDLELSKRAKRTLAAVLVPVLVLAGGGVACAGTLHRWKGGDRLDATDLNDNFSALDARVTELEAGRTVDKQALATLDASIRALMAAGKVTDSGTFTATFDNGNYFANTIAFKSIFTSPPLVFCSEWDHPGNWIFCKLDAVTPTSATFATTPVNGGETTYTTNIAWFAVGQ